MLRNTWKNLGVAAALLWPQLAFAVSSAELYTGEAYGYGRVEARVQYAPGDGVVSTFFAWKDGSEQEGTFWNELDFEKVGGDCRLETNPIYGNPAANHSQKHLLELSLCSAFHTYAYEWTPEAIVWSIDGTEIRRETGAMAQAYAENASGGMQIRFNLWPGDATFGGNFDPAILPVHQYVDWVQFSAYEEGAFTLVWREDFDGASLPQGWLTGSWSSPKNKSMHAPENVSFIDGYAVLSLTADDALGPAGALPGGGAGSSGVAGSASGGVGAEGGSSGAGAEVGGMAGALVTGGAVSAAGSTSPPARTDGGCHVGPASRPGALLWPLAAAALAWLQRRRRRQ